MKKIIAILTAGAILGVGAQQTKADHHHGGDGWSTAGKVLTGLVIGGAVARAFEPPPTVVYSPPPTVVYTTPAPAVVAAPAPAPVAVQAAPVYVQPAPVVVQPAPVVVYRAPVYRPYWYAPPLVSVRFGYGGGHWHHHH